MYEVWVKRADTWQLVGQYTTRMQAALIADDYRSHGEEAKVAHE